MIPKWPLLFLLTIHFSGWGSVLVFLWNYGFQILTLLLNFKLSKSSCMKCYILFFPLLFWASTRVLSKEHHLAKNMNLFIELLKNICKVIDASFCLINCKTCCFYSNFFSKYPPTLQNKIPRTQNSNEQFWTV